MLGIVNLSPIGIIFGGAVFVILVELIPQLKAIFRNPILSFLVGVGITFLIDDINLGLTMGDVFLAGTFIVGLLTLVFYWSREYSKKIEKLREKVNEIDKEVTKIKTQIDSEND